MTKQSGKEFLQVKLPITKNKKKFFLIGVLQLFLFIILLISLCIVSSINWYYSIIGEVTVSLFAVLPYAYITINSDKFRVKYREKYGNLAFQKFWYRFLSYNEPLSATGLFFPILLKTDYFLPRIIDLPSHFMTDTLLKIYFALPLGIFLAILGLLIRRPTGGYDSDIGSYLYLIYPEDSRKLSGGLYSFIRHPNYAGRGFVALGIGFLANNLLAICLSFIHFLFFYILSKIEDRELVKRFGQNFIDYKTKTPAMIPKLRKSKAFLKMVFLGEKN